MQKETVHLEQSQIERLGRGRSGGSRRRNWQADELLLPVGHRPHVELDEAF
jgi:hypothetical protein